MSESEKHAPRLTSDAFFQSAMDELGLDEEMQYLLRTPFRVVQLELPLRKHDDTLTVFTGFRVQHNNSRGPFKGGLRYHPAMDATHARELAALMTWKTALAGLPLGGGKGGINCNPRELTTSELEQLTKQFTQRMGDVIGPRVDVMAPDVGTGPREMAWIYDAYTRMRGDNPSVVTGKPLALGGSPGRTEATGRGVATVAEWAAKEDDFPLKGATVAIQGFGNVGRYAALYLSQAGAKVVAVSDVDGGLGNDKGLDVAALGEAMENGTITSVSEATDKGDAMNNDALLGMEVDMLIPAALGGAIHKDNADSVRARMIVEAANMPLTPDADRALRQRGVTIVPDILANAGGVTVSYLEWVQNREGDRWSEAEVNEKLEKRLREAWQAVTRRANAEDVTYRAAAYLVAVERVKKATTLRGFQ
ncbi:MAG: Glu/Leu/Phe/Val dehydrogenase dimerization domain-containing protein [Gammaproteobacteria bacterium]|jgi:glutamate dehydrogenase (NAD(P)+)